jgi:hypothetical protein
MNIDVFQNIGLQIISSFLKLLFIFKNIISLKNNIINYFILLLKLPRTNSIKYSLLLVNLRNLLINLIIPQNLLNAQSFFQALLPNLVLLS